MTPPQATTADAIALSARHIADTLGAVSIVAYTVDRLDGAARGA
jgi:hypothetical protein